MRPSRAPRRVSLRPRWAVALLAVGLASGGCAGSDEALGTATGPGGTTPGEGPVAVQPVVDEPPGAPVLPVTVRSADGRRVTVTDTSRIVPLWGDLAEIAFALGLGESVVGRDASATFDEAGHLPVVTRAHDVSAESVLSLRPTVVLADTETGPPEAIEHIRNVGIPVVVVERVTRVEDIAPRIEEVATALGVPEAGRRLAERTTAEIEAVGHGLDGVEAERPRVAFLYLRGTAGVYLLGGPGAGTDSMIEAAGGSDAGTAVGLDRPFTPVTSEALVAAAPDVLLVTTTGLESVGGPAGLAEVPGVAQTPAGRAGRIVAVEDGLLFSFGSRTPEALTRLAEGLRGGA